jgi:hypothetical protein
VKLELNSANNNDLWWHRPSFLHSRQQFPSHELEVEIEEEFILSSSEEKEEKLISTPFNLKISNFSSLPRLLNVTRYCLKFIKIKKKLFLESPPKINSLNPHLVGKNCAYWTNLALEFSRMNENLVFVCGSDF